MVDGGVDASGPPDPTVAAAAGPEDAAVPGGPPVPPGAQNGIDAGQNENGFRFVFDERGC